MADRAYAIGLTLGVATLASVFFGPENLMHKAEPPIQETARTEILTTRIKTAILENEKAERALRMCRKIYDEKGNFSQMNYSQDFDRACGSALYHFSEASRNLGDGECVNAGNTEKRARSATYAGFAEGFVAMYDLYSSLGIKKPWSNELFKLDSTDGFLEIAAQKLELAAGCAFEGSEERVSEIKQRIGKRQIEKGRKDISVGEST